MGDTYVVRIRIRPLNIKVKHYSMVSILTKKQFVCLIPLNQWTQRSWLPKQKLDHTQLCPIHWRTPTFSATLDQLMIHLLRVHVSGDFNW